MHDDHMVGWLTVDLRFVSRKQVHRHSPTVKPDPNATFAPNQPAQSATGPIRYRPNPLQLYNLWTASQTWSVTSWTPPQRDARDVPADADEWGPVPEGANSGYRVWLFA